jgi:uncharacterized OsmC-like protein
MEVLVKHESGFRFSATCRGYTVTTGRGEDGNDERDGMWPAQLFEASIGMCIGGYVAKFCKEQNILFDDITIELSRRTQTESSRTTRIDAKIHLDAKLSQEQKQGVLQAADRCHITNSIREGMQVVCTLAEGD